MEVAHMEMMVRILEAFLLSAIIGIDREKTGRPAGLKTHVIVALGACLVTIAPNYIKANVDITRMPGQVLSGIGFLGAGTILRYGENVVGLTTAASLWTSACLGIAAGLGAHSVAIITCLIIVTSLKLIPYLERKFLNKKTDFYIRLSLEKAKSDLVTISNIMKEKSINIKSAHVELDEKGNKIYKFYLSAKDIDTKINFLTELYKLDLVTVVEEEDVEND